MATVTTPPPQSPPPSPDELEALIEEARRRQRRRHRVIAATVFVAAAAAGVATYLVVRSPGGSSQRAGTTPSASPSRPASRSEIVLAANRRALVYGEIYQVGPDGHRVDLSRSPALDVAPAVSPDGKWVAFLSDRGGSAALYAAGIRGRPPRRLTPPLFPVQPGEGLDGRVAWSPDGRQVALAAPESSSMLYVTALAHPGRVRRVPAAQLSWFPSPRPYETRAFSADRSRVASWAPIGSSSPAPRWALTVSRSDGARSHTLVRTAPCARDWGSPLTAVQFTPGGRALVYESYCDEPFTAFYAIAPDGSHLRRLSRAISNFIGPAFSPDGRSIAFSRTSAMPCKGCSASIWLMDADGLHARALTSPSESVSDTGPSWSPDGKRIVFHRTSPVTGLDRLYVVSANGAPARALRVIGGPAAWGPKRIAYLSRDGQSIWTATPDGTHPRKLVTARGIGAFAWSRDGRLAYLSGHGTTLNVLGKTRKSFRLPHKAGADGLAWSPDGSRLLFTASAGTTSSDLYSIEANGRHLERLTSNMGDIAGMSWR